jgi:hypothetical protein
MKVTTKVNDTNSFNNWILIIIPTSQTNQNRVKQYRLLFSTGNDFTSLQNKLELAKIKNKLIMASWDKNTVYYDNDENNTVQVFLMSSQTF